MLLIIYQLIPTRSHRLGDPTDESTEISLVHEVVPAGSLEPFCPAVSAQSRMQSSGGSNANTLDHQFTMK
jgi:hypothetical protein